MKKRVDVVQSDKCTLVALVQNCLSLKFPLFNIFTFIILGGEVLQSEQIRLKFLLLPVKRGKK